MLALLAFYAVAGLGAWWFGCTRAKTRRDAFVWLLIVSATVGAVGFITDLLVNGRIAAPPSF